jgi:hypothetical protein
MRTETEIEKEIESEVLITKELNQLSFKDRNDYQGKCVLIILHNITILPYSTLLLQPRSLSTVLNSVIYLCVRNVYSAYSFVTALL